jgi:hypothetical protein
MAKTRSAKRMAHRLIAQLTPRGWAKTFGDAA